MPIMITNAPFKYYLQEFVVWEAAVVGRSGRQRRRFKVKVRVGEGEMLIMGDE
jgi:hypothetical protein